VLSLYIPGNSPIHRLPAWLKLLALFLTGTAVMVVPWPLAAGTGVVLVIAGYAVARIPARTVWRLTRTVLILVAAVAGCQWYFSSAELALLVALRILYLVAGANLVTLTTPTASLIATVETVFTPLARFGVRPERIGLAIALALRFIPVLGDQGRRIREAQAARGVKAPLTYLIPLVIRTLRMAESVGEALESRGLDRASGVG